MKNLLIVLAYALVFTALSFFCSSCSTAKAEAEKKSGIIVTPESEIPTVTFGDTEEPAADTTRPTSPALGTLLLGGTLQFDSTCNSEVCEGIIFSLKQATDSTALLVLDPLHHDVLDTASANQVITALSDAGIAPTISGYTEDGVSAVLTIPSINYPNLATVALQAIQAGTGWSLQDQYTGEQVEDLGEETDE